MAAPSTPRPTQTGSAKEAESGPDRTEAGDRRSGKPEPAGAAPASGSEPQEGRQEAATPVPQTAASPAPSSPTPSASTGDEARAFATEKPVIPPPGAATSTYVVTVDNRTGFATRVERLDEKSGERKEMSPMEYVQLLAAYYAPATGDGGVLMQAYLQGMKDYFGAQPRA